MYAGRKVEEATVEDLFEEPLHPYTRGLMRAIPRLDVEAGRRDAAAAEEIPGIVPIADPADHRLRLRAPLRFARPTAAAARAPPLVDTGAGHLVACWEIDRVRKAA
jgi:peptide/nickel transport system ATP-binding protein